MPARARIVVPVQEAIYRLYQRIWSSPARRRYQADFDRIASFCLFVGYPRSGHSVIGALLNAHRNAVISHELNAHDLILDGCVRDDLYARIIVRSWWFNLLNNRGTYPYQVPDQWQGRCAALRVIGDKRGGAVSRCIAQHPDFLARVRALVAVPLRLIHVVRNPFDNISAISIWNDLSLEESIDFYFFHCQTTATLGDVCDPSEVITVRHEEMIRDPRSVLSNLCAFLGLEVYHRYLDDCGSVVFGAPTYTRRSVAWPAALVSDVEARAQAYRFLDGYQFETSDDGPASHRRAP